MPATVAASYSSLLSVVQTLTGNYIGGDNTYTVSGLTESGTLTASTAVPATKQASGRITMSSGSGSINLVALAGDTADETVVLTGLKVQILKLRNLSTNANKITVAKGASNGYGLNAAADTWSIVLDPGQSAMFLLNETAPDVASGARVIDVTGTAAQILEYAIVAG